MSWPMTRPPVRPVQAHFHNKGSEPIKLSIGLGGPGTAWTCYDAAPGEVVEGPLGYAEKFAASGFTMISEGEAKDVEAQAEKAKLEAEAFAQLEAEERAAKAQAEAEAAAEKAKLEAEKAEAPVAQGETDAAPSEAMSAVEAQKAPDRKGRRADRSSTS